MGNVIIGSGRLLALRFIAPSVLVAVPVTIFVPIAIFILILVLVAILIRFLSRGPIHVVIVMLLGCSARRKARHRQEQRQHEESIQEATPQQSAGVNHKGLFGYYGTQFSNHW